MATIKCHIGKRGKATNEWNDGVKDHIYCMGWVDRMTDDPLPECLACPDHVSHAQDDLDSFYKEQGGLTMANEKRLIDANAMRDDWLYNGENEYVYDTNAVLDSIDSQPTVDAVEVVRCRDCKYSTLPSLATQRYGVPGALTCHNHNSPCNKRNVKGECFCPYGKRKDGDGNG